jgi:hypothetical protein
MSRDQLHRFNAHGGPGQNRPIISVIGASGGPYDFTLSGSTICQFGNGGGAGFVGLNINLASSISGRFVINGNRIGNGCPGSVSSGVGIALAFSGGGAGAGHGNVAITGNDLSAVTRYGSVISYTPTNESVVIKGNLGIDDQTASVADAATIAATPAFPNFAITGTGTTVTTIGTHWFANGEINMITRDGAITFSNAGGNICNTVTSAGAMATVTGRWNVGNNCWLLK